MNPILIDFPTEMYTERLYIRAPKVGDGKSIYNCIINSKKEFEPWLPFATGEQSIDNSEIFVRQSVSDFVAKKKLNFLVFLADKTTLIASSGYHNINWDVPSFEIGYWIDTRFTGKGYITEAIQRLTTFAFEDLKANRLTICCDEKNARSKKVPERLGYELECCQKHYRRSHVNNELINHLVYCKIRA